MKKYIFILVITIIFLAICPFVKSQQYNVYQGNQYSQNLPKDAREKILIIMDSSNSMGDDIDGKKKLNIAVNTVKNVLPQLAPDIWVGLRVYGHKTNILMSKACKASELKVPVGPGNLGRINAELDRLNPIGWTPITYSLKEAIGKDLAGFNGKKRIILLTDGGETCDESPCTYAVNLVKSKAALKIDVIAFNVDDPDAQSQLKCAALATSGKFYTAKDAQELGNSLNKSLNSSKDVHGVILK